MAQQTINIGTNPDDGTGENLRSAFDKINDNFGELYTELGGSSLSNITISGNTLSTDNTNGNINLDPNGTGNVRIVSGDFLPASDSTIQNVGTSSNKWTNIYATEGHFDSVNLSVPTQSSAGPAGGAGALPATPEGYFQIKIGGTAYLVPYYAVS